MLTSVNARRQTSSAWESWERLHITFTGDRVPWSPWSALSGGQLMSPHIPGHSQASTLSTFLHPVPHISSHCLHSEWPHRIHEAKWEKWHSTELNHCPLINYVLHKSPNIWLTYDSLQLSFISPGITQPSVIPPTARGPDLPEEKIAEIENFPTWLRLLRCQILPAAGDGGVCCIGGPLPLLWPWCQCLAPGTVDTKWDGARVCLIANHSHIPRLGPPVNPTLKEKSFSSRSRKQSTDNNKKATDDWLRLRAHSLLTCVSFCSFNQYLLRSASTGLRVRNSR